MKIVALAGGVGGAKLAYGLAQSLPPADLTVIVNTADDFEHMGLRISPDLDTVCYTLAGLSNEVTGWGRADETWNAHASVEELGGPAWFQIGDRDLGTHLERTRRLKSGETLSQVVRQFSTTWRIKQTVLPMTDDQVRTVVRTDEGDLEFQEYFVHRGCQPRVSGFAFRGADAAKPAPGVIEALEHADGVIICPSNPWVSIGPILAIEPLRAAIDRERTVAVSPIVGGKAIKGPAAKMYRELGVEPSAFAVAGHYQALASGFVMDDVDQSWVSDIRRLGMRVLCTQTLMARVSDRRRLADDVLNFVKAERQ